MKRHSWVNCSLALLAAFCMLVGDAHAQPVPDKEYRLIATPQPPADPKKIEVIEFLLVRVSALRRVRAGARSLAQAQTQRCRVQRSPMVFRENWKPTAKALLHA
jgi:hypothetical protein